MTGGPGSALPRGGHGPPRFDLEQALGAAHARGWPLVMGVLNVTPDSFSDGGRFLGREQALAQALRMAQEGADIVDVGGESTRPGAAGVGAQQELDRVLPVLEAVRARCEVALSIDTSKAAVMREAARCGAGLVNDVRALREPGALEAAAGLGLPVVLMHMQGEPRTMQRAPHYDDVVGEVRAFLLARARACREAGIAPARIVLDPGFGFGKDLGHNLTLLKELRRLADSGYAVAVGLSRKSMIEKMIGRPPGQRGPASVALALAAAARGASVVRVHDVAATVDALRVWARVEAGR